MLYYSHGKGNRTESGGGRKNVRKVNDMKDKVQLMSANGDKRLNRKVLERNALDILTAGEIAMDFEDALAWVESASKYELIRFLIDNN